MFALLLLILLPCSKASQTKLWRSYEPVWASPSTGQPISSPGRPFSQNRPRGERCKPPGQMPNKSHTVCQTVRCGSLLKQERSNLWVSPTGQAPQTFHSPPPFMQSPVHHSWGLGQAEPKENVHGVAPRDISHGSVCLWQVCQTKNTPQTRAPRRKRPQARIFFWGLRARSSRCVSGMLAMPKPASESLVVKGVNPIYAKNQKGGYSRIFAVAAGPPTRAMVPNILVAGK